MPNKRTNTDVNLDNLDPIHAAPDSISMSPEAIQAAINTAVDTRLESATAGLQLERADHERQTVVTCLQSYLAGNAGDNVADLKFRNQVQDLILEVQSGKSDPRPYTEILADAGKFAEAKLQAVIALGGDEGAINPQLGPRNQQDDGRFNVQRFFHKLEEDIKAQGAKFSYETLGKGVGCPEFDFVNSMPDSLATFSDKHLPGLRKMAQANNSDSEVIPIPVAALQAAVSAQFAETYTESVASGAERREPTFRADLLVPHYRPANVLGSLGVPRPVIANDQTLPRLSASLSAAWLAENASITDGNITVASLTTSPKRLGVRDDISWMTLAAANEQLAITPLVISEIMAATEQS